MAKRKVGRPKGSRDRQPRVSAASKVWAAYRRKHWVWPHMGANFVLGAPRRMDPKWLKRTARYYGVSERWARQVIQREYDAVREELKAAGDQR